MYSLNTSLIIAGMLLSGTGRSVGVKVFYQLGFDNPMFVALLYLFGQSLALLVYGISKYVQLDKRNRTAEQEYDAIEAIEEDDDQHLPLSNLDQSQLEMVVVRDDDDDDKETSCDEVEEGIPLKDMRPLPVNKRLRRQGSKTGLTDESENAVAWVHLIPWQLKPLLPGLFNLANAALKWASFLFVAASIAEMLMSGLEVVLSTVVARLVRKRRISRGRWTGVAIVTVGLATVHLADLWQSSAPEDSEDGGDSSAHRIRQSHLIGGALIVGQCVTAVGQDIAEELFLQESQFPATLLLGMEGVVGLVFGIPLYLFYFAPETPSETLAKLQEAPWKLVYMCFLTTLFTITGIFNIMTTSVTSSMTRNMWKNCRTLMVWLVELSIFYSHVANNTIGEQWILPDSFFILGGFLLMLTGIYVYYNHK